jgi:cytochrome c-type biogenesis protein CcmH/NrfG
LLWRSRRVLRRRYQEDEVMAILALAAVVALSAAFVAWRTRRGAKVVAGLGLLAGALAMTAWILRPGAGPVMTAGPDSWLVDSAQAFNRPAMQTGSGPAGSLPELADRLAARLAQAPDDAAGWSLLAATYRQLGREEEAVAAERRAVEAGGDPSIAGDKHRLTMGSVAGSPTLATVASGKALAARHVAEGQRLRIQRKFSEAEREFRKAVEADPGDADSWADLADCAAVAAGHDLTVSRDAIEQALTINSQHRKALWLRATLELQQKQYSRAAATWRTLSTLVPAGSPDARVISANIAEAETLAAGTGREG